MSSAQNALFGYEITVLRMKWIYHIVLIAIGLFFTVLFGFDGVYVGFIASETELAQYPWGTELGWSYLNKTNYMIKGTLMAALSWLPLIIFNVIKHLRKCKKN